VIFQGPFKDVWDVLCGVTKVMRTVAIALVCDAWIPVGIKVGCHKKVSYDHCKVNFAVGLTRFKIWTTPPPAMSPPPGHPCDALYERCTHLPEYGDEGDYATTTIEHCPDVQFGEPFGEWTSCRRYHFGGTKEACIKLHCNTCHFHSDGTPDEHANTEARTNYLVHGGSWCDDPAASISPPPAPPPYWWTPTRHLLDSPVDTTDSRVDTTRRQLRWSAAGNWIKDSAGAFAREVEGLFLPWIPTEWSAVLGSPAQIADAMVTGEGGMPRGQAFCPASSGYAGGAGAENFECDLADLTPFESYEADICFADGECTDDK
jgi:hypothetical protein